MDALNKEIGEKQEIVTSGTMIVTDAALRIVDAANGKEILELSGESMPGNRRLAVSKAKVKEGGKIKVKGLWVSEDKKGLIHSLSTLAVCMRHYKVSKPKDFVGKKVDLVLDDAFMVIKAY